MKQIRLSVFSVLLVLSAWTAHAQTHSSIAAGQLQDLFLGTKTPYTAPEQPSTPPPAGYRPVFINYVGRHGARYLTKAGADLRVWDLLAAAEKSHSLTATGLRVKEMTARLLAIQKDKYEQITGLGRQEQTAIGARMLSNYGDVFRGRGLKIVTTYKLRTQQSAEAFLLGLSKVPGKREYARAPDSLDAVLRFYDLSPAYQRYKKSATLRKYLDSLDNDKRTALVAAHIWEALFTTAPVPAEAVSFADNLYDLYSVQFSLPDEIRERGFPKDSVSLGIAFDRQDLEWLDYRSQAQDFLEKGPGFDPSGIQVRIAAPLLADFLKTTEQVVHQLAPTTQKGPEQVYAGAVPDAILRFTHAEAISPFAALLGIPEASTPASSIYDYRAHWQAQSVIPLSANIAWILYTNGQDWLVKVLLNERESALPLPAASFPYYRWENVEEFYRVRLSGYKIL